MELRAGLRELDERAMLARLVEAQAAVLEELERQSVWLRAVGWAAGVWLLLVVIGLVVGLVVWLV